MVKVELTEREKKALEMRHRRCRDGREKDRIKAVLLSSEKWTVEMIAQVLRITESSVKRHLSDYKDKNKLSTANGGSYSYLSAEQTKELVEHISNHTYQSSLEIIAYIKKQYEIKYTVPGLNKWLHRQGFVYKQTKGMSDKINPDQQDAFVEKHEAIKDSLGKDDVTLFGDGVRPTMSTKIGYGWIKKGTNKSKKTANRKRTNLMGAKG